MAKVFSLILLGAVLIAVGGEIAESHDTVWWLAGRIIIGLGMFGVSFFFMAAALSRTDLTLAYPMMSGLVYIILLFVGFFIFKEKITVLRIMGIGAILLGITMLTIKS